MVVVVLVVLLLGIICGSVVDLVVGTGVSWCW